MPFKETIPGEVYNVDETIKVYVKEVNMESKKESIILSRSDARFLFKLFSHEIPEIENGDIYIRSIARLPGVRSKIVVSSKVPGLDAAGTCIGKSGSRIIKIVEQLARGAEKIDVIEYYDDPLLTLKAALSPAIVEGIGTRKEPMKAMVYSSETKRKEEKSFIGEVADVVVSNETFTLAIGIRGQNAFLAKKLSKFDKLNIVRVDDALGKINYRRMAEIEAEYAAKNNGFVSEEEVIVRPTVETKPVTNVETETISKREFNKEAVPTPTPTTIEEYVEVTPISVAKGPHINVVEVEKKEETPVEVEVHTGPSKKSIKKEEELAKKLAEEEARRNGMAIYSEEELAEFEQEEYIDEEEDEIDYEDYDEYYDSY